MKRALLSTSSILQKKQSTLCSSSSGSWKAKSRSGLRIMSDRSTSANPKFEASKPMPSSRVFSEKVSAGIVTSLRRPSMSLK